MLLLSVLKLISKKAWPTEGSLMGGELAAPAQLEQSQRVRSYLYMMHEDKLVLQGDAYRCTIPADCWAAKRKMNSIRNHMQRDQITFLKHKDCATNHQPKLSLTCQGEVVRCRLGGRQAQQAYSSEQSACPRLYAHVAVETESICRTTFVSKNYA